MTGSHAPDEDAGLLPKAITYDGGPTWRMLLPHIDALANHAPPSAGTETTAFLLNQAGVFPGDHGQVGPERVSRHVQETLAARSNLAVADEAAGRPGPGISLMPG